VVSNQRGALRADSAERRHASRHAGYPQRSHSRASRRSVSQYPGLAAMPRAPRSPSARTSASPTGPEERGGDIPADRKQSRQPAVRLILVPTTRAGSSRIGSCGAALRSARSECRAAQANVAWLRPIVSAIFRAARPWPARRRMRGLVSAVHRGSGALGPVRDVAGGLLKSAKNLEAN
jgi:hypothetical protein